MNNHKPEVENVKTVAGKYLNDIINVERVPKGWSTYVYRVITGSGTYYVRFLPEDASFAAEVLAHNILLDKGVIVPRVVGFEHRNEATGFSLMVTAEIPGVSVEDDWPHDNPGGILREAGRQLALVHEVTVDGFGWIDRTSYDRLKGEHSTFQEYFTEFLSGDLQALGRYGFPDKERAYIADLMEKARLMLDVQNAVLVHGDFDISHIYHSNGGYSGLIDLGEIRGNNRLFDLATFTNFVGLPDRIVYSYLLEGYREITPLTNSDLYAVELMALLQTLRLLGKRLEQPDIRDRVFRLAKKQIDRINSIYN